MALLAMEDHCFGDASDGCVPGHGGCGPETVVVNNVPGGMAKALASAVAPLVASDGPVASVGVDGCTEANAQRPLASPSTPPTGRPVGPPSTPPQLQKGIMGRGTDSRSAGQSTSSPTHGVIQVDRLGLNSMVSVLAEYPSMEGQCDGAQSVQVLQGCDPYRDQLVCDYKDLFSESFEPMRVPPVSFVIDPTQPVPKNAFRDNSGITLKT